MSEEGTIPSLRKELHRYPELSGEEQKTSDKIAGFLKGVEGLKIKRHVGGHGIIATKRYGPGQTIAFRAELDGLPIEEDGTHGHKSKIAGRSHACGHDGHMGILLRLLEKHEERKTAKGSLALIFQPAEETGQGARAMIETGVFENIKIDHCYALHNIPGSEMGVVYMREGTFACASVGLRIELAGKTAHAAHPEQAVNPLVAAGQLLTDILKIPEEEEIEGFALITAIALQSGDENFGTSPEKATLMFTLRADSTESLDQMVEKARSMVKLLEVRWRVLSEISLHEYFPATVNGAYASRLRSASDLASVDFRDLAEPFRWSEDFGQFGEVFPIAMFGLGSGEETAPLHASTYDFPDQLIDTGSEIFYQLYNSHFP